MRLSQEEALVIHHGLITKATSILSAKRQDYSGTEDPFLNFRKSEMFKVAGPRGVLIRITDKLSRLEQFMETAQRGDEMQVKDESLIDTGADVVNYAGILVGLIIEMLPQGQREGLIEELKGVLN